MHGVHTVRIARQALIACAVVLSVAVLSAQTVVDPRFVEFDPSTDHNATTSNGTPLVQSYNLSLYQSGATTPFTTVSLGKPSPAADGKIRVDFIALLSAVPAPNILYEARVSAVGPGGSTASTPSNGFSFSAVCTYAITPTSQSAAAGGGSGSFAMTTAAGCTWTAASNAPWITVTGGASGNGSGTVTYSVAPNPTTSPLTGTITAGGRTFTITQAAAPCTYEVDPDSVAAPSSGATGSFAMRAGAGCTWTAASGVSWITVTGGASGTSNGTVNYSVATNPSTSPRTGAISVGGVSFTVMQAGAPCTYSITPTSRSVTSGATTGSFAMSAAAGCAWTATSGASWITVTGTPSGSGNGTVNYSAAANPNTAPRTGTITVGGQTFALTQAAAPCTYALSPTSQSVAAGGGPGSFAVTTPSSCSWTASSNAGWLTVTGVPGGSGNGTVNFSVAVNPNTTQRTGTITVNGQTFTVTQNAAPCTFAISPGSQTVAASGGTGSFALTAGAGCSWTATDNASWITLTGPTSGSGGATISFSAAANPNSSQRTGTISVGGQSFTVNQTGTSCTYSVAPLSQSMASAGGSGSAAVTSIGGCSWTATAAVPWITVTSGATGSGSGTVNFSVAANAATTGRTGTLTIAGEIFTVSQAAAPCTYAIAPSSQAVVSGGGAGFFAVTAGTGCSWTASSGAAWISVTGPSGSGNGTVAFTVAANTTGSQRVGTISVGGQTFTVTQAAPCSYAISPASQSVPSTAATGSFAVTAGGGCSWTATSSAAWLTVTGTPSGAGNGTVTFSTSTNPNSTPRTATISVGGQTFTVTQAATSSCSYSISPTSRTMSNFGGSNSLSVTTQAGCTWTAVSNTAWLSVIGGASGTGNGTVYYRGTANSVAPRVGTLTVAGYTFTVNQNGTCS
jgi:hypothetical protein